MVIFPSALFLMGLLLCTPASGACPLSEEGLGYGVCCLLLIPPMSLPHQGLISSLFWPLTSGVVLASERHPGYISTVFLRYCTSVHGASFSGQTSRAAIALAYVSLVYLEDRIGL